MQMKSKIFIYFGGLRLNIPQAYSIIHCFVRLRRLFNGHFNSWHSQDPNLQDSIGSLLFFFELMSFSLFNKLCFHIFSLGISLNEGFMGEGAMNLQLIYQIILPYNINISKYTLMQYEWLNLIWAHWLAMQQMNE